MKMHSRGLIIVVSAPSGAGKSTLCNQLIRKLPNLTYSISYTTRPPRPGEEEGVDYFFTSERTFRAMARRGRYEPTIERVLELSGVETLHSGGMAMTRRVAAVACIFQGDRVLVLASGHGRQAIFYAQESGAQITGVDPSKKPRAPMSGETPP
jgi:guanylate kinase